MIMSRHDSIFAFVQSIYSPSQFLTISRACLKKQEQYFPYYTMFVVIKCAHISYVRRVSFDY
jgi:hypothetical protein